MVQSNIKTARYWQANTLLAKPVYGNPLARRVYAKSSAKEAVAENR